MNRKQRKAAAHANRSGPTGGGAKQSRRDKNTAAGKIRNKGGPAQKTGKASRNTAAAGQSGNG